jgi:hypothetical protein
MLDFLLKLFVAQKGKQEYKKEKKYYRMPGIAPFESTIKGHNKVGVEAKPWVSPVYPIYFINIFSYSLRCAVNF